jgi:hypothetical protein
VLAGTKDAGRYLGDPTKYPPSSSVADFVGGAVAALAFRLKPV